MVSELVLHNEEKIKAKKKIRKGISCSANIVNNSSEGIIDFVNLK